jgi:hypothetical protein
MITKDDLIYFLMLIQLFIVAVFLAFQVFVWSGGYQMIFG